jgi:hypothetical protein
MSDEGNPVPDEWNIEIQELSDCILWDADYESDDLLMDRAPEEARELRREMDIDDAYFDAVTEDLADQQAGDRVAELRKVCEGVVGE